MLIVTDTNKNVATRKLRNQIPQRNDRMNCMLLIFFLLSNYWKQSLWYGFDYSYSQMDLLNSVAQMGLNANEKYVGPNGLQLAKGQLSCGLVCCQDTIAMYVVDFGPINLRSISTIPDDRNFSGNHRNGNVKGNIKLLNTLRISYDD